MYAFNVKLMGANAYSLGSIDIDAMQYLSCSQTNAGSLGMRPGFKVLYIVSACDVLCLYFCELYNDFQFQLICNV